MASAPAQVFEAAAATLNTNELLHHIISAVPIEHWAALRRVSNTWNLVVSKIGYKVDPIRLDFCGCHFCPDKPIYPAHVALEINPVFDSSTELANETSQRYYVWFSEKANLAELTTLEHEFITDPPITQVGMMNQGGATLRVREGIRVGDLLEYFAKMNPDGRLHFAFAMFAVAMERIETEYGEADSSEQDDTSEPGDGDGDDGGSQGRL